MKTDPLAASPPILLLIAGAKGAVGSTLAAAAAAGEADPETVIQSLISRNRFSSDFPPLHFKMAGWDGAPESYPDVWKKNGILPDALQRQYAASAAVIPVRPPPDPTSPFDDRVKALSGDFRAFMGRYPGAKPVFINLLPAAADQPPADAKRSDPLSSGQDPPLPDTAYAMAAATSGIPVVNFTPNALESDALLSAARQNRVPIAGRDGKTGQTFFKVVLASALKARGFSVKGWYSLNLLGNADGKNLMIPENAAGKLANKTAVLDAVLEPSRKKENPEVFHTVRIDYYPPRGDAKEAWDLIDFTGLFGLPMSLRVNLLGRDSVLAAPMILDLARWMVALKAAGRSGAVPELAFFFKTPVGSGAPVTFQDQLAALDTLERAVMRAVSPGKRPPA